MKRLMLVLSAAALALGLRAADPSGISFETGEIASLDALNSADASATWTCADDNVQIGAVAYEGGAIDQSQRRPAQFVGEMQSRYLSVRTDLAKPLTRAAGGSYTCSDTLVRFTAFGTDMAPTLDADDKIAVWTRRAGGGGDAETRILVTAGYCNDAGGVDQKTYDCGALSNPDDWHRVTIRLIADAGGAGRAGFVLFLDGANNLTAAETLACGEPKTASDAWWKPQGAAGLWGDSLFPSLVTGISGITATSVAGRGCIDDVSLTDAVPSFAADRQSLLVTWNADRIASVTWDGTLHETPFSVGYPSGPVGYSYKAKSGYADGVGTFNRGDDDNGTYTLSARAARIRVGDRAYATLTEALADISAAGKEATVGLLADYDASGETLNVENGANSTTLDLAGRTLTGCVNANSSLVVVDSVGTGGILPAAGVSVANAAIVYADALEIVGGRFDGGLVAATGGMADLVVRGGKFIGEAGGFSYKVASGCVPEMVTEGGRIYWVVVKEGLAGSGTAADPYLVSSARNLVFLKGKINAGEGAYKSAWYKQTADIVLPETGWDGIGRIANEGNVTATDVVFKGVYDGNGKSITVTLVNDNFKKYGGGLFVGAWGATFKNMNVTINAEYTGTGSVGASIFGIVGGDARLINVTGRGTITASHSMGGFTTKALNASFVGCTSYLTLNSAKSKAGAFVGFINVGDVKFENCGNFGVVKGTGSYGGGSGVGGFVGNLNQGKVSFKGCTNNGAVSYTGTAAADVVAAAFVGTIDENGTAHTCVAVDLGGNMSTVAGLPLVGGVFKTAAASYTEGWFIGADGVTVAAPAAGTYTVGSPLNKTALAITGTLVLDVSIGGFAGTVTAADETKTVEMTRAGAITTYTLRSPAPIPPIDPTKPEAQAVREALAKAGIPADDPIMATVTTAADVAGFNALLEANGVSSYGAMGEGQRAHLDDSFVMREVASNHLFAQDPEIRIEKVEATDTNGKFAFEVSIRDGASIVEVKEAAAAAVAGSAKKATTLGQWGDVVAADIDDVEAKNGKASFTIRYGDGTMGFLKIKVGK